MTNPYLVLECAQRTDQAKAICMSSAGCKPPVQSYEQAQAEAARRSAAQAQVQADQANVAAQAQADYVARQQQRAACIAAADITALSINNFWGGLFAGLGVGAVCMP